MPFFDGPVPSMTLLAALGSGLMAGLFFTFSNFVMRALARIPPAAGLAAMQSINVTVINRLFLAIFVGTAGVCLGLVIIAAAYLQAPGNIYRLVGGLSYLLGNFGVTVACNVPLNNRLARLDPEHPESESAWREYVRVWTRWNHVRTVTGLAAAALLTIALWQS